MDAPDKFQYKWINLDSVRLKASIGMDDSVNIIQLPPIIQAAKNGSVEEIAQLIHEGISVYIILMFLKKHVLFSKIT